MLVSSFSPMAMTALALIVGSSVAEPLRQPYRASTAARMSVRQAMGFGLGRRSSADSGYTPADQFCGAGDTCPEACGANYQTCASTDNQVHCFDPSVKQTCCPNGSGDACDAGFFCSADAKGATWCCPDSMTLEQCAQAYGLPGVLTSDSVPTSTPAPAPAPPPTSNDIGLPTTTTNTAANTAAPVLPPPASTPSDAAPTSQIFVETSASTGTGGGAHGPSTCQTLTSSEIIPSVITPDESAASTTPTSILLTAPPLSTTSTILIPAPTVRPSSSSTAPGTGVAVPTPSSNVPIAAANSRWSQMGGSGVGTGLLAAVGVAVVMVL
ncbi:uncharacterized protein B0I36DRAFT_114329 [Microdochium trichocladiopsis]|uniref:Prp 4 CRoW domain-containing protein n=1 Tax=Microdochium trichocladiopsis TaxID=1682393 RepID=A0A9P8Y8U0_9PEZI|nr:uncharacterized protein B0I36DRAFT_114329 [Microdochium trichocladiopsis]KAH7030810.1 hypothetical protein B0I36DRAFT_114329 [Microdochium trichocladiopsis]